MFICGCGSFSHEDEDEKYSSKRSISKRSRSKRFTKYLSKKNPYADRGLDKFSALVADLEDQKQKIYAQTGSEDISFVQFVYSNNSKNVRPIVVKAKNKNKDQDFIKHPSNSNTVIPNPVDASDKIVDARQQGREMLTVGQEQKKEYSRKRSLRWNENFRRPYCWLPAMLVLVLLFLAIYGRSFAILCTLICWYLIPTIVEESSSNGRKQLPRRKESNKNIVYSEEPSSPTSHVIN